MERPTVHAGAARRGPRITCYRRSAGGQVETRTSLDLPGGSYVLRAVRHDLPPRAGTGREWEAQLLEPAPTGSPIDATKVLWSCEGASREATLAMLRCELRKIRYRALPARGGILAPDAEGMVDRDATSEGRCSWGATNPSRPGQSGGTQDDIER